MGRARKKPRSCTTDVFQRGTHWARWALIGFCSLFVLYGWCITISKFLSRKTSLSITYFEANEATYPSVTFCPGFRLTLNSSIADLNTSYVDDDFMGELMNASTYTRPDFMSSFAHTNEGEPDDPHHNIINDTSKWKESIPHFTLSGKCFTYDPEHRSLPGKSYGMRITMNYPFQAYGRERRSILLRLGIYLHEKDKFFFFQEGAMPGNVKVDTSRLSLKEQNSVTVKYSRLTSLSKPLQPCVTDRDYSYLKCFEKHFAERRGCQKPWTYFPEFDIPKCRRADQLQKLFDDTTEWTQPFWSTMERSAKSGCLRPCNVSGYELEYSFLDKTTNEDLELYIWFADFKYEHEEEYYVCDATCFLGELGGNLGFFLGGSILAIFDIFSHTLSRGMQRFSYKQ